MLSLENSYNADDLIDFDRKATEGAGYEKLTYCVEPKFDGASISLVYENDLLIVRTTTSRGFLSSLDKADGVPAVLNSAYASSTRTTPEKLASR